MNPAQLIQSGNTSLGIEFGSTRIKAVMIEQETCTPIAAGAHDWENRLENGVWTYSIEDIHQGLQSCFAALSADVQARYGVSLETTGSIGISAMMHGYLAFDQNDQLLVPFRTWRNTMTEQAAAALTEAFRFNIPQRWSIAHLYQAMLKKEAHLPQLRFFTTLAGYVHWLLTGQRVLGIGDASGMFPIDPETKAYNTAMLQTFSDLTANFEFDWKLSDILPAIVPAGECAGTLTDQGARLLDPSGRFKAGIPFCPPEGDAGTGMVATNSIAPKTGNVSAGTSIFAMAVLEHDLQNVHEEIDIVATPCGSPVAMVHCNNCTTELDAWVRLLNDTLHTFGLDIPKAKLYDTLYETARSGANDCDGLLSYNYHSGEHVTGFTEGRPLMMRTPDTVFNLSNLMRSLIYSCMATLKIGMDILLKEEHVVLDKLYAHGGLFKSPVTGQRFLAAALETPIAVMESAGEGGAWGIALLASYLTRTNKAESLAEYLNDRVFRNFQGSCMDPVPSDVEGFAAYMKQYRAGLAVEQAAVSVT